MEGQFTAANNPSTLRCHHVFNDIVVARVSMRVSHLFQLVSC